VAIGRGCPFGCTYCFHNYFHKLYKGLGSYIRKRRVSSVIKELKSIQFDYKRVVFQDDVFTLDRAWVLEFCKAYRKAIRKPFSILSHIKYMDFELAKELKKTGCEWVKLGVESGSPKLRENLLKRVITNEEILKTCKAVKKASLKLQVFVMFGTPGETPSQMWKTVALVKKINPDSIGASIFYPYPRTELAAGVHNFEGSFFLGYSSKHPHYKLAKNLRMLLPIANKLHFLFKYLKGLSKLNFGGFEYVLNPLSFFCRRPDRAFAKFKEYTKQMFTKRGLVLSS
jgi:biotin synthase-like enzyme